MTDVRYFRCAGPGHDIMCTRKTKYYHVPVDRYYCETHKSSLGDFEMACPTHHCNTTFIFVMASGLGLCMHHMQATNADLLAEPAPNYKPLQASLIRELGKAETVIIDLQAEVARLKAENDELKGEIKEISLDLLLRPEGSVAKMLKTQFVLMCEEIFQPEYVQPTTTVE